jgi:hypothetical protein
LDELIHVEVLGRTGEVVHRIAVRRLPATIGRAYDNDVIIDDPYVSPHHLRVERLEDRTLRVLDLDSRNGLYVSHPNRRVTELAVSGDTRLRIGHTLMRLRGRDWPVPPEEPDDAAERWRKPGVTALALAAYLALLALHTYASTIEDFQPARLLAGLPFALIIPAIWSGIWAAIGRLFSGRASFLAHCTVALTAASSALVIEPLLKLAAFALSMPVLASETIIAIAFIVGGALYVHLRLVTRLQASWLAAGSAVVVLMAVVGTRVSTWLETRDDVDRIDTLNVLYPSYVRVVPADTPAQFMQDARALEKSLLKERDAAP